MKLGASSGGTRWPGGRRHSGGFLACGPEGLSPLLLSRRGAGPAVRREDTQGPHAFPQETPSESGGRRMPSETHLQPGRSSCGPQGSRDPETEGPARARSWTGF